MGGVVFRGKYSIGVCCLMVKVGVKWRCLLVNGCVCWRNLNCYCEC